SFAELAADLARDGVQSVVVGSAIDQSTTSYVGRVFQTRRGSGSTGPGLLDVAGKTDLPALARVVAPFPTLVPTDPGAMHVAAAAGVPVTAVFGPTRDRETRPIGDRHTVLTHDVWCRPCMLRECPLNHRCMRGITPSAVLASTRRAL